MPCSKGVVNKTYPSRDSTRIVKHTFDGAKIGIISESCKYLREYFFLSKTDHIRELFCNFACSLMSSTKMGGSTLSVSDKDVKSAIEELQALQDERGEFLMHDLDQWYAIFRVLFVTNSPRPSVSTSPRSSTTRRVQTIVMLEKASMQSVI